MREGLMLETETETQDLKNQKQLCDVYEEQFSAFFFAQNSLFSFQLLTEKETLKYVTS